MAVTEYCLHAIQQQLADDDLLEATQGSISLSPTLEDDFIDSLEALQEKIKARRNGQPIDIDRLIEEMRAEREEELLGLR